MTCQILRYLCVGFRREIQLYFRHVSGDSEGRPATVLRARQVRGGAAAGGVGGDGGQGDVDEPEEDLDNEVTSKIEYRSEGICYSLCVSYKWQIYYLTWCLFLFSRLDENLLNPPSDRPTTPTRPTRSRSR